MTHDVIQQLEAYGEYADAVAPAISTDELDLRSAERMPARAPQRRTFPNWVVAAGAAAAVFILIGGVLWLLGGSGSGVVDEPMPVTTSVAVNPTTIASPPPVGVPDSWNPILATTRAGSAPAPATCPEGTNPDAPGPADQARPAPGDWNNQSAVFDTHAGRIVYVDETAATWTFDVCTNTWQQMNPERPPAGGLTNSQLVYDVDSDRTVGIGPGFVVVYDANTNTWTQRSGFAGVDPRTALSTLGAVYDPISGLVVVGGTFAYDVDTDTWTPLGQLWCSPSMVYDPATEQWSPVEWVPGCQPTLIGYSVDTDRMFFLPYQAEGLVVNPRTGEWNRLEAPGGGVTQPYGLVRYATGADTAYTYGDHGICRLDPVTLEWDCNPVSESPDLPAAMVYDSINNRIVAINDWSGDSPYGSPPPRTLCGRSTSTPARRSNSSPQPTTDDRRTDQEETTQRTTHLTTGRIQMTSSRSLCWIACLATVVLLLAGCDATDSAGADTTLAATTTTAPVPTTTVETDVPPETTEGIFDFSTQSLCDWFSPEEIDAIVTSTYEQLGVPLDPGDEMDRRQDQNFDCYWASPLVALGQSEGIESLRPFVPHPALDQSARVSILGDGNYGLTDGIEAVLAIDGHPELLRFGHATSDNLGGDVGLINTLGLTIANEMLKRMGWIETN